ncbi:uncharacterized protein [Watersipora subatra]|uniref:uncharacterized protein n=1 Tax=Watersipora subatra TaxID=2589382 RepID=UPI00355B17C6
MAHSNQDMRCSGNSHESNMSVATLRKPFNYTLTLYVKCVPKYMTEEAVRNLFHPYGKVVNVRLDVNDAFPKNRAQVEMSSKEECDAALAALDRFEDGLGGRIFVEYMRGYQQGYKQHYQQSTGPQESLSHHNVRSSYDVGAGRGSTLLSAANASSPVRASPSHHRDPFLAHTGQFTPSGRGSARGRPFGPVRGRGYMGRPMQPRHSASSTYNAHNFYPQRPPHLQRMHRPPHPQNMQRFPHPRHYYRGRGQVPYAQRASQSNTQLSPTSHKSDSATEENAEPCLYCKAPTVLRCFGCKVAPYCSRKCQTTHWTESHRLHCGSMKKTTSESSSAIDLSQFSVSFNQSVIETMKEMPAVVDCLNKLKSERDSDAESVSSGRSEDPGLPFDEFLQVKLNNFVSPSQFYIQRADEQTTSSTLPRVWECCLHGIVPADGASKWSDKAVKVCSAAGLALGGPCKVLCYSKKNSVYQTKVILGKDVDLADCLVNEGIAQVPANTKHEVNGSLHRKLEPGQAINLRIDISSIKGVTDFYAQVVHQTCSEEFQEFPQMQTRLNSYATHIANKPPADYRAIEGDYVLAPYENVWYRGLITAAKEHMVVVAYIDYGNISTVIHSELVPLPRQFTYLPALAVLCKVHGLDEPTDPQKQEECVKLIKDLLKDASHLSATVRTVDKSHITVDLFNPHKVNMAETFLRLGCIQELSSQSALEKQVAGNLIASAANDVMLENGDGSLSSVSHEDMPVLQRVDDGLQPLQLANEDMPPLQPANENIVSHKSFNEDLPHLLPANEDPTLLEPDNEDMPPLESINGDMPALQPVKEGMPALQPANDDMPALQPANDDMPALQPANDDMPALQPANDDMPALQPANDDMPALQPANDDMPALQPANEDMPSLQSANENMPSLQASDLPSDQLMDEDMPALELVNDNKLPLQSSCDLIANRDSPTPPNSSTRKRDRGLARQKETSPARHVIYAKDIPNLTLLPDEQTRVRVVNASDLHSLYISSLDQDNLHNFVNNMKEIKQQSLSNPSRLPPKLPLIEGEALFALEPKAGEWDRVEVLNFCPNQPLLRVRSIDSGTTYDVDIKNVREMTKEAALLVASAVRVILLGVEGPLSAEGATALSSLQNQQVLICCRKLKGQQPLCDMETEDGQNVNRMIRTFCSPVPGASNGLNSHGSSSDGSHTITSRPPSSTIDTLAAGEGRSALLEQQIETFRSEIQLLKGEITLLRANKNTPRKKAEAQVEEFTL